MTKQVELWRGPFGDQYHERNKATDEEIEKRVSFWKGALQLIYTRCDGAVPRSILEIGAGNGANLLALGKIFGEGLGPYELYATEINEEAKVNLTTIPKVTVLNEIPTGKSMDLVFTYGVLIHTHPAHLLSLQTKIYNSSARFIMCAEYFSPCTRPIEYRGEKEAMWADDFGGRWLDSFKLRLLGCVFCWKRTTGLDNVTVWAFEKMESMQ